MDPASPRCSTCPSAWPAPGLLILVVPASGIEHQAFSHPSKAECQTKCKQTQGPGGGTSGGAGWGFSSSSADSSGGALGASGGCGACAGGPGAVLTSRGSFLRPRVSRRLRQCLASPDVQGPLAGNGGLPLARTAPDRQHRCPSLGQTGLYSGFTCRSDVWC